MYCCVYDPGERQGGCQYDYYPLAEVPLNQKALLALIVTRRRRSFVQQVDCVTLIKNPQWRLKDVSRWLKIHSGV